MRSRFIRRDATGWVAGVCAPTRTGANFTPTLHREAALHVSHVQTRRLCVCTVHRAQSSMIPSTTPRGSTARQTCLFTKPDSPTRGRYLYNRFHTNYFSIWSSASLYSCMNLIDVAHRRSQKERELLALLKKQYVQVLTDYLRRVVLTIIWLRPVCWRATQRCAGGMSSCCGLWRTPCMSLTYPPSAPRRNYMHMHTFEVGRVFTRTSIYQWLIILKNHRFLRLITATAERRKCIGRSDQACSDIT